jgi:hypothetical protein
MTCLMIMMQKIPSHHLSVQDVAGRPSLAEGVNANRYCGSALKIWCYKDTKRMGILVLLRANFA